MEYVNRNTMCVVDSERLSNPLLSKSSRNIALGTPHSPITLLTPHPLNPDNRGILGFDRFNN